MIKNSKLFMTSNNQVFSAPKVPSIKVVSADYGNAKYYVGERKVSKGDFNALNPSSIEGMNVFRNRDDSELTFFIKVMTMK